MREETTCKPDYSNSIGRTLGLSDSCRLPPMRYVPKCLSTTVLHNPLAMLNGGASLALAEIAAGHGSMSLCREGEYACGIQVSGNHISSVPVGGKVIANGQLIHRGNSSHIWNIDITTPEGKLVSTIRVVNFILKKK